MTILNSIGLQVGDLVVFNPGFRTWDRNDWENTPLIFIGVRVRTYRFMHWSGRVFKFPGDVWDGWNCDVVSRVEEALG